MNDFNRLALAQRGDETAFAELTAPFRYELQLHCYRILGSFQDAEDLLQETLLAAWRGLERFEGRSSLRAWLYTIATNRCLNFLRDGRRRPQAAGVPVGARSGDPVLAENFAEISWLQPYPDSLLEGLADNAPGPEARYEAKESIALAFVSGLQHLAPRQRAVLVLRDVLGFHADEVAEMLGTSVASVTSALQRARSALEGRGASTQARDRLSLPGGADQRELVARFAEAFQNDDVDGVLALLTDDVVISMPPEPLWRQGIADVGQFLRDRARHRFEDWAFVQARANGQPALAYYLRGEDGVLVRSGMFVIGVRTDGIESVTRFPEQPWFSLFGVPEKLD
jgi:RNA polymerase sigma-70 factor (TIGR02960 family)